MTKKKKNLNVDRKKEVAYDLIQNFRNKTHVDGKTLQKSRKGKNKNKLDKEIKEYLK